VQQLLPPVAGQPCSTARAQPLGRRGYPRCGGFLHTDGVTRVSDGITGRSPPSPASSSVSVRSKYHQLYSMRVNQPTHTAKKVAMKSGIRSGSIKSPAHIKVVEIGGPESSAPSVAHKFPALA